ncbi:MAG TPA: DICT sensory domain-containing protein [Halococcus sp.]|nr:DICT sensory domain-containing protein [Halococcus sp.]
MSFAALIDTMTATDIQVCVYNYDGSEAAITDIASYFDIAADDVSRKRASDKPDALAVITAGDDLLLEARVSALFRAVTTTVEVLRNVNPNEPLPSDLLVSLTDATFTSHDRRRLLVASRHIERRVHRVGSGTLYASFQHLSRLANDLPTLTYYNLLARAGVDVYVYGVPDEKLANADAITVIETESDEIASTWMVAFDGDGDDDEKAALVAKERAPNDWRGFWTFDSATVDDVIEYTTATYN